MLLILAGISLNLVLGNNGIIKKAQEAKTNYTNASEEEKLKMEQLAGEILDFTGAEWTQLENSDIKKGSLVLKIGDYINYDCDAGVRDADKQCTSSAATTGYSSDQVFNIANYSYGWRVLGLNEQTGELLITSEDFVPLGTTTTGRNNYYLQGKTGYKNAEYELDRICSFYGKGTGATGGRSIDVKDINKITGYDPEHTGLNKNTGTGSDAGKYGAKSLDEYGNRVEYSWDGTEYPAYTSTAVASGNLTGSHNESRFGSVFCYYKDKKWTTVPYTTTAGSITDLISDFYMYYPQTLTSSSDTSSTTGIATDSNAYKMLFTNSEGGANSANKGKISGFDYWLGDSCIKTDSDAVKFLVRYAGSGWINGQGLCISIGLESPRDCGVRPVVSLQSNITLKRTGETKDGCNVYDMSVL